MLKRTARRTRCQRYSSRVEVLEVRQLLTEYVFQTIADSDAIPQLANGVNAAIPAINDQGTVVFRSGQRIYTTGSRNPTTIQDYVKIAESGDFRIFDSRPKILADGEVLARATFGSGGEVLVDRVLRGNGESPPTFVGNNVRFFDANDSGDVVVVERVNFDDGNDETDLFIDRLRRLTADGSTTITSTKPRGPLLKNGDESLVHPLISNQGTVAHVLQTVVDIESVNINSQLRLTTGQPNFESSPVAFSNNGDLFVWTEPTPDTRRLERYNPVNNSRTTVLDVGGSDFLAVSAVSANDHDEVAFTAFTAEGTGIYTGPDRSVDTVLEVGSSFLGRTVITLAMGEQAINASGEITFLANLEDAEGQRSSVVAVAVPDGDIRWAEAESGEFSEDLRWEGNVAPAADDDVLFDVEGEYVVSFDGDATTRSAEIRKNDVVFDLVSNEYSLTTDTETSLLVDDGGELLVVNGTIKAEQVVVGLTPESPARLLVTNLNGPAQLLADTIVVGENTGLDSDELSGTLSIERGATVSTLGNVTVGSGANGEMVVTETEGGKPSQLLIDESLIVGENQHGVVEVTDGGEVIVMGPVLVGSAAQSEQDAELIVSGMNNGIRSTIDADGILVGRVGQGFLTVDDGGRVAGELIVIGSEGMATATVSGGSGSQPSELVAESLFQVGTSTIGLSSGSGSLLVKDGGLVDAGEVNIGEIGPAGVLKVKGISGTGLPSRALVKHLAVNKGVAEVTDGGVIDILEHLSADDGGRIEVSGVGTQGVPSELTAESLTVGNSNGDGTVVIADGAFASVTTLRVGAAGETSTLFVGKTESEASRPEFDAIDVFIGSESAQGQFVLSDGDLNIENQLVIAPGSVLLGSNGKLNGVVVNGGLVGPGNSPGVMTIDGDFTNESTGVLEIEIAGLNAGEQYDQLIVTGDIELGGELRLIFLDGYVPGPSDTFDFLVSESVQGAFDQITVTGLPDGMVVDVDVTGDGITLGVTGDQDPATACDNQSAGTRLQGSTLFLVGTNRNDRLEVHARRDTFKARRNKTVRSFHKDHVTTIVMCGQKGRDRLMVGSTVNVPIVLHGGDGRDVVYGGRGPDTIFGGADHDRIYGRAGDDSIYGESGNDSIKGDNGADFIHAGFGRDWLWGGDGPDTLIGSTGSDRLRGGSGSDVMLGGTGSDRLWGESGRDILIGGESGDTLWGGQHEDLLIAGTVSTTYPRLDLIRDEWASRRSYSSRLANLRGIDPDEERANGTNFLSVAVDSRTAFDDSDRDFLSGSSGRDWFFAARGDRLSHRLDEELDLL